MALAGFISLLRIAALPIIIYFLLQNKTSSSIFAVALFLLALCTDILDDYFRKGTKITPVGSFLDPFADKILVLGLLFFLVWKQEFSLFLLALLLLREILAGVLRWSATREDIILQEKRKYAEFATVTEFALVLSLLLKLMFPLPSFFVLALAFLTLAATYASLLVYLRSYSRELLKRRQQRKEIVKTSLLILANKRSRGYHDLYRRKLLQTFSRRRSASIYYLPSEKNMFEGIDRKESLPKHLVIAGGDGSFESALNYRPFWKKSLGFFPLGAGNAFYSYFYRGKRFEYLRSRFHFQEKELDVLELSWEGGKTQTTFLCLGLDAEIIQLAKRTQQAGWWDYFFAGVQGALRAKAVFSFRVTVEGNKQMFDNCVTLTLAKIPYFGFNLRSLIGKVDPADEKVYGLAVVNTHPAISNKLVRLWALLFANFNILKSPFVAFKGKEIKVISAEPFPLQAGGEFLGFTKWVKVRVIRKQKVLVV